MTRCCGCKQFANYEVLMNISASGCSFPICVYDRIGKVKPTGGWAEAVITCAICVLALNVEYVCMCA
jgi:hypothetical protein